MRRFVAVSLLAAAALAAPAHATLPALAPPTANPSTTGKVVVIAHRGSHNAYGENSVAALRDAYKKRASCSDADARKTSDGKWIAYHDHSLDWKTDGTGAVADRDWAYIRTLRYDVDGSPVATLAKLIKVASRLGRYCLVMELPVIPSDEDLAYFEQLISKHRMVKRFVWYTANQLTASRLDAAMPIPVWHKAYQQRTPEELVAAGFDGVMPRQTHLSAEYVALMRDAGLRIVPLLANRKKQWQRVEEFGLDGFFTDRPAAATKWIRQQVQ